MGVKQFIDVVKADIAEATAYTTPVAHPSFVPVGGHATSETIAASLFVHPTAQQTKDIESMSVNQFLAAHAIDMRQAKINLNVRRFGFDLRDFFNGPSVYSNSGHLYLSVESDGLQTQVLEAGNTSRRNGNWSAGLLSAGLTQLKSVGNQLCTHRRGAPVAGVGSIPKGDAKQKYHGSWALQSGSVLETLIHYDRMLASAASINGSNLHYNCNTTSGNMVAVKIAQDANLTAGNKDLFDTMEQKGILKTKDGILKIPGSLGRKSGLQALKAEPIDFDKMTVKDFILGIAEKEASHYDTMPGAPKRAAARNAATAPRKAL